MHNIEPYYNWQLYYDSAEDERSPFHGIIYNEFEFTKKIYNYLIHPQWDDMGSPTLYLKVIYANYDTGFAVIELIGEWNDCINNDVMYLKTDVVDRMQESGINKFALVAENVLNFHSSDDSYYEEWYDDLLDNGGWVMVLGLREHVEADMRSAHLDHYLRMNHYLAELNWRGLEPDQLFALLESLIASRSLEASAEG